MRVLYKTCPKPHCGCDGGYGSEEFGLRSDPRYHWPVGTTPSIAKDSFPDSISYAIRVDTPSGPPTEYAQIYVSRLDVPRGQIEYRPSESIPLTVGVHCARAFRISDQGGEGDMIPEFARGRAIHGLGIDRQARMPFTHPEEYVAIATRKPLEFAGGMGGGTARPTICGAPLLVRVFDGDMMMECYRDGAGVIQKTWGEKSYSMHQLWAKLVTNGLRALLPVYYRSSHGCGPLHYAGACMAVSAVLAEEWYDAVVLKRGDAAYLKAFSDGDMAIPQAEHLVWERVGGLAEQIVVPPALRSKSPGTEDLLKVIEKRSEAWGSAHMVQGIARGVQQAKYWTSRKYDAKCLAEDFTVVGETLILAQETVLEEFLDLPIWRAFARYEVIERFGRRLKANIVAGLEEAREPNAADMVRKLLDVEAVVRDGLSR